MPISPTTASTALPPGHTSSGLGPAPTGGKGTVSHNSASGAASDDGYDGVWFEDGDLEDVSVDCCSHVSVLNREWKRRHEQFHTMGYRDGITAGKEASAQEGFNAGFRQSVHDGYKWGLVRGISSAMANLSDQLKEKLMATPENRYKLLSLHESVQTISTNDALKMFHDRIHQTAIKHSHDHTEGNSHETVVRNEDVGHNPLENLFRELMSLLHQAPEIKVNAEFCKEMVG